MKLKTKAILLLVFCTSASADDSALARCRAVVDSKQRLVCYDALPLSSSAGEQKAEISIGSRVPAANVAATPANTADVSRFGLEQQIQKNQPERIESSVQGPFDGWTARSTIQLTNGQIWQVVDGSRATLELMNPKVVVRKGFMGAFYLELDGTNQSARVRRVK